MNYQSKNVTLEKLFLTLLYCFLLTLLIFEEIWQKLGNDTSVTVAEFPSFNESYLIEDEVNYPVSFNGKMRFKMSIPVEMTKTR